MLKAILSLHDKIAADVYPSGGTLTCRVCDHTQPFTTADAAHYLKHGWPRHCGKEMLTESRSAESRTGGKVASE